jgi:transcriptional regulator with XRE-family HTH domain
MTTPAQLKAARALVGLSQPQIAQKTGLSTMSIKRAEGSGAPAASVEVIASIRAALESAGVIFVDENGEGPGVRLRKIHKGEEIMKVETFKIESEAEADDYLKDLLEKDEYRSMNVVEVRAQELIKDEHLKNYFINKAKEILKA